MRCKNCGFENEDGRYICQNCGSPLYDENDSLIENEVSQNNIPQNNYPGSDGNEDKEKIKKSIIIIVVLAVILVALVAGIIFASSSSKKDDETSLSLSISETVSETESSTKRKTTTEKATEEAKTEKTTKETTTESTTTTTTAATYNITVDIDGNGSVSGDGAYTSGKKATFVATADDGFEFAGWYDNSTGALVASGKKYTVTVKDNLNLTAKFTPVVVDE